MLVLSRKQNERIILDCGNGLHINLHVVEALMKIRLGFEAPSSVGIYRYEIIERPTEGQHVITLSKPNEERQQTGRPYWGIWDMSLGDWAVDSFGFPTINADKTKIETLVKQRNAFHATNAYAEYCPTHDRYKVRLFK